MRGVVPSLVAVWVVCAGGCNLFGPPADEGGFDAPDSSSKMFAINRAGAERDRTKIPQIIDCLESDDPAVRFMAIGALQEMTGQTLGYDYGAPEVDRERSVKRWREWSAAHPGGEPLSSPPVAR